MCHDGNIDATTCSGLVNECLQSQHLFSMTEQRIASELFLWATDIFTFTRESGQIVPKRQTLIQQFRFPPSL